MIINVLNNYDVNLIMPISKVDENMDKAHLADGLLTQKFLFRSKIVSEKYKKSALKESDYLFSKTKDTDIDFEVVKGESTDSTDQENSAEDEF